MHQPGCQWLYSRLVVSSSSALTGSGENHVIYVNLVLSMLGKFSMSQP